MSDQNVDQCSRDAKVVPMNQEFYREQTRESFVEGSPTSKAQSARRPTRRDGRVIVWPHCQSKQKGRGA